MHRVPRRCADDISCGPAADSCAPHAHQQRASTSTGQCQPWQMGCQEEHASDSCGSSCARRWPRMPPLLPVCLNFTVLLSPGACQLKLCAPQPLAEFVIHSCALQCHQSGPLMRPAALGQCPRARQLCVCRCLCGLRSRRACMTGGQIASEK